MKYNTTFMVHGRYCSRKFTINTLPVYLFTCMSIASRIALFSDNLKSDDETCLGVTKIFPFQYFLRRVRFSLGLKLD